MLSTINGQPVYLQNLNAYQPTQYLIPLQSLNALNLQSMPMCTRQYTDCSMYGGYDPRDPCKHTCMSKVPIKPV